MKRFFIILGVVLAIAGCGKDVEKQEAAPAVVEKSVPANETVSLTFKREDNQEKLTLESSNFFETATLKIDNKEIELKEAVSGSGTRLVNENEKIEIQFKGEEGILSLDGKDINIVMMD